MWLAIARGAQPYSSIVILCDIGGQLVVGMMGTAMGTSRRGGGRGRSVARATVAEPNLSGFARSESQQSGDGCHEHQGDACLGWAGWAAKERSRGGGATRGSHTKRPTGEGVDASFDVLRQWRPHAERLGGWRAGSEVTQSSVAPSAR